MDVSVGISNDNYLQLDVRSQNGQIIKTSAVLSRAQLFAGFEALSIYRSEVSSSSFKTDGKMSQLSIPSKDIHKALKSIITYES